MVASFAASFLEPDLVTSEAMEEARGGGLTGSYAGLSGSARIGPGVDGVEWDAHFVPKPRVKPIGVVVPGVCGAAVMGLIRFAAGVAAAAAAAAACRIICSGIAGLGG